MAGNVKSRIGDDDVYEATAIVNGGDLVIASGVATNAGLQGIAQAGATSAVVLGVAARRAEPVANQALTGTDGDGFPVAYPNPVNELTTVYKHCVTTVVYTAVAVAFGVKLKSAAAGQVAAWVSGTDPAGTIIGECRVVGGMGAGGGAGLAYIY
jgi:hypothetical protein